MVVVYCQCSWLLLFIVSACSWWLYDSFLVQGLPGPKGEKGGPGMKGDRGSDVSYNHIFHRGNRFLWANDLRPVCLFVQGIDGQAGRNGTDGDTGRTGKPGKQVRIDFMFVLQFLTMRVVFVSSGTLWRPRRTWLPWCTRSKRTAWEKCEQNVGSSLSPVPCSPLSSPSPPLSIPSPHTHTYRVMMVLLDQRAPQGEQENQDYPWVTIVFRTKLACWLPWQRLCLSHRVSRVRREIAAMLVHLGPEDCLERQWVYNCSSCESPYMHIQTEMTIESWLFWNVFTWCYKENESVKSQQPVDHWQLGGSCVWFQRLKITFLS